MMTQEDIVEKLRKIVLFDDFKGDQVRLSKVCNVIKYAKFKAGENIIKEGDLGDRLFILYDGSVRIMRKTLTDENYTVVILNSDLNIFFGEIALIDSDKRSATVYAETDCETLYLDRENYLKLCEEDPMMGYKITFQIAKRISASLRKMNQDVISLFQALVDEVEGIL